MKQIVKAADYAKIIIWHGDQVSDDVLGWWVDTCWKLVRKSDDPDAWPMAKEWGVSIYRIEEWLDYAWRRINDPQALDSDARERISAMSFSLRVRHLEWHRDSCPCRNLGVSVQTMRVPRVV